MTWPLPFQKKNRGLFAGKALVANSTFGVCHFNCSKDSLCLRRKARQSMAYAATQYPAQHNAWVDLAKAHLNQHVNQSLSAAAA
jgi:hypothetical protein